jgi:hypothetical protein
MDNNLLKSFIKTMLQDSAETDTQETTQVLLQTAFSIRSVQSGYTEDFI